MTRVMASCVACTLALCSRTSIAVCQAEKDHSGKIIEELTSHVPKGAILFGKDLPVTVKGAVKELVKLTREHQTVEDLTARLIVIRDMNRYLDYKKVVDAMQRDLIKRFKTAFTLDEQWPIYVNGLEEQLERGLTWKRPGNTM